MAVVPGKQNNTFEQSVVQKISKLSKLVPETPIQVDGGLTSTNIPELINAGASTFAVGSFILKSESPIETYKELCGI